MISMKELEERLPSQKFMRVHKSFIVSLAAVTGIEGNKVLMKNNKTEVLLGEAYRNAFLDKLKDNMLGR